jgi:hypothetical protein
MQGDDIQIAFHQHGTIHPAQAIPGLMQAVKHLPLVVQRTFGRVQIFGLPAIETASPQSNQMAATITNRKNDPVAKTVINRMILAATHQPCTNQCASGIFILTQLLTQKIRGRRSITQFKAGNDFRMETPALPVLLGRRIFCECIPVQADRLVQNLPKRAEIFLNRLTNSLFR